MKLSHVIIAATISICSLLPIKAGAQATHADGTAVQVAAPVVVPVNPEPVPALTAQEQLQVKTLLTMTTQLDNNTAFAESSPVGYARAKNALAGRTATLYFHLRQAHHIPDPWTLNTTTFIFVPPAPLPVQK